MGEHPWTNTSSTKDLHTKPVQRSLQLSGLLHSSMFGRYVPILVQQPALEVRCGEDPLGGGADARHDDDLGREFCKMQFAMAGEQVDPTGAARRRCQLHVVRMIADHPGAGEVKPMRHGGLVEKPRLWFDAVAAVFAPVGAGVDLLDADPRRRQSGAQIRVQLGDSLSRHLAAGDPRLVRDDEEAEVLLKPEQGWHGVGEQLYISRGAQAAAILDEGAVAVEEDGGMDGHGRFMSFLKKGGGVRGEPTIRQAHRIANRRPTGDAVRPRLAGFPGRAAGNSWNP